MAARRFGAIPTGEHKVRSISSIPPLTTLAFALLPAASVSQQAIQPFRTDTPPVIDGRLDDPVWSTAPFWSGFKTFHPDYGQELVGETQTFLAYDVANLYFAFRSSDPEPDKIKASVTSRDNIRRDDWVAINLDSFNDQQTLYAFYVNPFGIQGDSRYSAGHEDHTFDLVWYSSGQIDEHGYTVEIQIPLQSIRYTTADTVTMGVILERHVARDGEFATSPPLDPAQGDSWLTQMRPIQYYELDRQTLLEVLPAITYSHRRADNRGRLVTEERHTDLSVTTKYGITSDLIFDGTYNPDFSQVEADAGQVDINLRYSLYYPEKRPFFLEAREAFTVASTAASERDPVQSVVYTRTIVDPIVGARLSGKLGSRNTLASIYALDEIPPLEPVSETQYAHFPIIRYKRSLDEDSYLGGIYAARELSNEFNRVGGLDGQIRTNESTMLGFHGLLSRSRTGVASDDVAGHSVGIDYLHTSRDLDYHLVLNDISREFRVDMGYVWRTGLSQMSGLLRPKFYFAGNFVRRIDAELFTAQTRDKFSDTWETFNHISLQNYLWGRINFRVKYSYSTEIFLGEKFTTGGFHAYGGGQWTNRLFVGVLFRNTGAIFYSTDPYQGRSNILSANFTYQASDKLRGEASLTYSDFYRESDSQKVYDYLIVRGKLTYQLSKYLLFRGILEYNDFRQEILTDLLASFTYIPGTVAHIGYGSLHEKTEWQDGAYVASDHFRQMKQRFFFKASYLWRM
ncbi:MAG: carbohydrate binding family 9 domain-containing protein [Gemmatimonadota bacterium]|nr:MAG: carbohydrate binding family 9 domain-containing protein [Gemmatimonadota bacterium]